MAGDDGDDPKPLVPLDEDEVEELRETLAARVKQAREEAGLTTGDVARAYGKTTQWVRHIENGNQWPPPWYLVALSRLAGRPTGTFFPE